MEKYFTFKNYFIYALRYWIVLAVCAVIGLGGGIAYGALNSNTELVVYNGGIVVGGFGEFADYLGSISEKPEDLYSNIRSDAFNNMKAEFIKINLYSLIEEEWRAFKENRTLTEGKAKSLFFQSFDIHNSGNMLYVSFTMSTKFIAEREKFAIAAVEKYIDLAYEYARDIDSMLARGENTLNKFPVFGDIKEGETELGMLKGGAIGVIIGVIAGLIVELAMFFTDRRIISYAEIAPFTGRKLFDATSGTVTDKVCPLIDREMNGSKVLLISGSEDTVHRAAVLYSEYSPRAGYKCLRIDFTDDAKLSDSLEAFLLGGKVADCTVKADGYDVMYGKQSWSLMLKNADKFNKLKDEYDRIIISAAYTGDGRHGILGEISDKVLIAVNHKTADKENLLRVTSEVGAYDKITGAVIENTGRSYVGGDIYVIKEEEE